MEPQPLDKAVKKSLEKLEIPFNADHWNQLEGMLNNLPVGDETAIDALFDAQIKHKIGAIETPLNTAAWAGIEAGLVAAALADAQFDEIITNKIGNIEGNAIPNWTELEPVSYTHLTLPTICSV